jgi:hypothetical protein
MDDVSTGFLELVDFVIGKRQQRAGDVAQPLVKQGIADMALNEKYRRPADEPGSGRDSCREQQSTRAAATTAAGPAAQSGWALGFNR